MLETEPELVDAVELIVEPPDIEEKCEIDEAEATGAYPAWTEFAGTLVFTLRSLAKPEDREYV